MSRCFAVVVLIQSLATTMIEPSFTLDSIFFRLWYVQSNEAVLTCTYQVLNYLRVTEPNHRSSLPSTRKAITIATRHFQSCPLKSSHLNHNSHALLPIHLDISLCSPPPLPPFRLSTQPNKMRITIYLDFEVLKQAGQLSQRYLTF